MVGVVIIVVRMTMIMPSSSFSEPTRGVSMAVVMVWGVKSFGMVMYRIRGRENVPSVECSWIIDLSSFSKIASEESDGKPGSSFSGGVPITDSH